MPVSLLTQLVKLLGGVRATAFFLLFLSTALGMGFYKLETNRLIHEKEVAVQQQALATAKTQKAQAEVTVKVVTKYIDKIKVVHERGETITKEIPVFVPIDSPPISGGFRLWHDALVQGTVPDSTRIPDAAPVPTQDLAYTIKENYIGCQANAEQLISLQEWIREQQKVTNN